ncbi:MAG: heme lyase CcmF/NrfE family subunit, partial [Acidobacteria bacterium]|nr:heme lyase CcmF/NrfE family subunit [Acidobacteriota bacterium]
GSLLFWTWLVAGYCAVVVFQNRKRNLQLLPYMIGISMVTAVFFTSLTLFMENPFQELVFDTGDGLVQGFMPPDGRGLNPILQHPAMVIHPPMLYLGFTGFLIPFSFAMAALWTRQPGENWIRTTRRWTMVPWLFLSMGVLLGGFWAYATLGWGGYWGWDPVENASLLPWLSGTAFLHSVMIQERRGMLKVWNVVLVMVTFFLCIFGTYLTRSGIISSVHTFAQSPLGIYMGLFLVVIVTGSVVLLFRRLDYLRSDNKLDSIVSRESGFLFNNWILLAAVFAVLCGTMFPILSEAVKGVKISVGPPYFNQVIVPIGLMLLFLTGVGPLLAWRKTSAESLRRNFFLPVLGGLTAGWLMAVGIYVSESKGEKYLLAPLLFTLLVAWFWESLKRNHYWLIMAGVAGMVLLFYFTHEDLYPLVTVMLCAFVTWTIVVEFVKGAKTRQKSTGESFFAAMYGLVIRNTRRYGGYVIHFGIVLLFVGFVGKAFTVHDKAVVREGEEFAIGRYSLRVEKLSKGENPNYLYDRAVLSVAKGDKFLGTMTPERRFFKASEQPTSVVAIRSLPHSLTEDFYVVFAARDERNGTAVFEAYVNPLVSWVWIGGIVTFLGTLLALVPNLAERRAAQEQQETKVPATREEPVFARAAQFDLKDST